MSKSQPLSDQLSSLTLGPSKSKSGSNTQSLGGVEYANEKENAGFHEDFPDVPEEERLVAAVVADDTEKVYVSEKHVYHMNFWTKNLILMDDVTVVDIQWNMNDRLIERFRLMTQHIQFTYVNKTGSESNSIHKAFDIICNRWRACLNRTEASHADVELGDSTFRPTLCRCSREGKHDNVLMEGVFLGTPKEMHHLAFMSEFGRSIVCRELGNDHGGVHISDWASASLDDPQVRTITYKYYSQENIIHVNIIHYDPDHISVESRVKWQKFTFPGSITQCTMCESGRSSRFIITNTLPLYDVWCSHAKLVEEVCILLHNLNVNAIQSLEIVQDVFHAFEPSRTALLQGLLLSETKKPNSNQEHVQKCMKFLELLGKSKIAHPPSLLAQDEIFTLVNLDPETADVTLSALEPSSISSVFDLVLVEAKSSNLDDEHHQKCMRLLDVLVRKHNVLSYSPFAQDEIHRLVDLEPEISDTILSALEPSRVASIIDLLLIEGKTPNSDLEYHQKCMRILQILVKKHNVIPPSLLMQDGIDMLVDLDSETAEFILFSVESSRVPPLLDLLLAQARISKLKPKYSWKYTKWLRLLVNKHYVLPPSLFIQDIIMNNLRIVAIGGYSDIYKGVFESKSVCLKVLKVYIEDGEEKRNKDLREFYKETLLWTQLSHENLLPFLGVNITLFPGKLTLVAPWMTNGEITKYLKVNPTHDRLRVISEIAAGIMYLHSRNIVHGDIKGANVLVDEQGQCYLADFGLATASVTSTLLSTATASGGGKGTMRWMAPELFTSGETEVDDITGPSDEKSFEPPKINHIRLARDIYAYACTVYEIVAEQIPFAHLKHDAQVMFQVLSGNRPERPTAAAWCPITIWSLVEKCWAQEGHLRPTAVAIHTFLIRLEQLYADGLPWGPEPLNILKEHKWNE